MNQTFREHIRAEAAKLGPPSWRVLESAQGARVRIGGEWKISFCSNNYLGLANHPAVREAAAQALAQFGAGMAAARSLSGSTPLHEKLEREIAEFKGTEAALVFNSGFATNSGVIPALVGKRDAVFSDEINHGSIVDGCRLSGAEKFIYPHGDMTSLERHLADAAGYRQRMIVADAVFSMDGDIAPLEELVALAERYDAFLMVDEAHATGVLGDSGRGAIEHFHLEAKVDIVMGTLGKALGAIGGYIAGDSALVGYLARTVRTFLLTTSLPAPCAAAALVGLRTLRGDQELRKRLWENTMLFRRALQDLGFDTMKSKTPIVPILVGDDGRAREFQERLYQEGVYVAMIGAPYVPRGTSRLRTIVSATHTENELREAIGALESIGRELRII
jgi:glycine C-acetyltransferase